MGKKSKTPKAPDYSGIAKEEAALDKAAWQDATGAARPNQVGPGGSSTWEVDDAGNWTQSVGLSDTNQGLYEGIQDKAGQALEGYDAPDFSGVGDLPEVGGYNQQAIDTIRALQAPDLERRRSAKEAQMAAMGLGTGSGEAWDTGQQNINDAESRADLNAILSGIEQGNTEFNQGMDLYSTGIAGETAMSQAKQQGLTGLMGLGRDLETANLPAFQSFGPPRAADLTGASQNEYSAALDKTNARNADKASTLGTVGTIGTIGATIY